MTSKGFNSDAADQGGCAFFNPSGMQYDCLFHCLLMKIATAGLEAKAFLAMMEETKSQATYLTEAARSDFADTLCVLRSVVDDLSQITGANARFAYAAGVLSAEDDPSSPGAMAIRALRYLTACICWSRRAEWNLLTEADMAEVTTAHAPVQIEVLALLLASLPTCALLRVESVDACEEYRLGGMLDQSPSGAFVLRHTHLCWKQLPCGMQGFPNDHASMSPSGLPRIRVGGCAGSKVAPEDVHGSKGPALPKGPDVHGSKGPAPAAAKAPVAAALETVPADQVQTDSATAWPESASVGMESIDEKKDLQRVLSLPPSQMMNEITLSHIDLIALEVHNIGLTSSHSHLEFELFLGRVIKALPAVVGKPSSIDAPELPIMLLQAAQLLACGVSTQPRRQGIDLDNDLDKQAGSLLKLRRVAAQAALVQLRSGTSPAEQGMHLAVLEARLRTLPPPPGHKAKVGMAVLNLGLSVVKSVATMSIDTKLLTSLGDCAQLAGVCMLLSFQSSLRFLNPLRTGSSCFA